jgi:hypothetical protein
LYSIIVVPRPTPEDEPNRPQLRLAPGERLAFGRSAHDNDLIVPHDGVSRRCRPRLRHQHLGRFRRQRRREGRDRDGEGHARYLRRLRTPYGQGRSGGLPLADRGLGPRLCPAGGHPALIAALLKAESNFDPGLSDPTAGDEGEYGIARWSPSILNRMRYLSRSVMCSSGRARTAAARWQRQQQP